MELSFLENNTGDIRGTQFEPGAGTANQTPVRVMSDGEVMAATLQWMKKELRCAAGRREFNRGRYMIEIAERGSVARLVDLFKKRAAYEGKTACLMVFNAPKHHAADSNVAQCYEFLANQVADISPVAPHALVDGAPLSLTLNLLCPVTNVPTLFDDFECIAFCPQSLNRDDPLYDPLMYAPFPAVNIASDVYGFSQFVAESALAVLGRPAHEMPDIDKLRLFFDQCVDRWHRLAISVIGSFAEATDTRRCPVHVTADRLHWVASHKDPAFAELRKEQHVHELPKLYAVRIVESWLDHFAKVKPYCAAGLSREGTAIAC